MEESGSVSAHAINRERGMDQASDIHLGEDEQGDRVKSRCIIQRYSIQAGSVLCRLNV